MLGDRFKSVPFDEISKKQEEMFRQWFECIEGGLSGLDDSRNKSLAITNLEDAWSRIGQALGGEQLKKRP